VHTKPATVDVVVIGAGIAGLMAAARAGGHGRRVLVLEKSRGVGGRMATRRVGGAVCDHGAQFFTQRTPGFHALIEQAVHEAAVVEWCRGFARDGSIAVDGPAVGDGHPRYRGPRGMTDLPKWLAVRLANDSGDVEVRTAVKATAVAVAADRVRVTIEGQDGAAEVVEAAGCVLTAPVPQALDLLAAGGQWQPIELRFEGQHPGGGAWYAPRFIVFSIAIDTPGIREFALWELGIDELPFYFEEFAPFAEHCKFNSCSHTHEPGCAVKQAVEDGLVDEERYASYLLLSSEQQAANSE
jgi:hypothetical protein